MSPGRSVGRTSGKSIQREDCEVDFLSLPRFRMSNSVLLCPFRRPQESISDHLETQRHSFASVVLFLLSFLSLLLTRSAPQLARNVQIAIPSITSRTLHRTFIAPN